MALRKGRPYKWSSKNVFKDPDQDLQNIVKNPHPGLTKGTSKIFLKIQAIALKIGLQKIF